METEDRYRTRYLDLLDEVDAKEKRWAEMDQRLRRILAHLLIVSEGTGSPEISAELLDLKESLRDGIDFDALEERIEALKERVLRETRWAEASRELPPLHHVLIHLVERLPLLSEMTEQTLALIESLEAGVSPHELPDTLDSIAGLVYQVRSRMQEEKRELETLLREVTDRLRELDEGVVAAHREAEAGLLSNRSFDAAVSAEVRDLENSTRQAPDLDTLRAAVRGALDSIRHQLEEKRRENEAQETNLEQEVDRLRHTIARLEGEVTEYREKTRQAREASLHDSLTGCHNRLAFHERAQVEEARWQRYGSPLSLVVFDLDRFKSINDTFGHRAGDQVLKTVAQIARGQLRQADFFARYGGEEFAALLPEARLDAALVVAEKVRRAVAAFRFHSRGERVPISLSGGVAQMGEGDTMVSAFERADRALYLAKAEGRDRCATERDLDSSV